MQTRTGGQIDCNPKFRHQQIVYPSHIDQGKFAVWLDLNKNIEITVWTSLSPCRRAEEIRGRHAARAQRVLTTADFGKG